MDDFDMKIGVHIKNARMKKGITQEQLAELSDLSTNHISKVERGMCSVKLKNISKICKVLDLSLDILISDTMQQPVQTDVFSTTQMTTIENYLKEALSVINTVNDSTNGTVTMK